MAMLVNKGEITDFIFNPHEDKSEYVDNYSGLKKDLLVEDAKVFFNERQIDINKCRDLLTKIIYLAGHGEEFTDIEMTDLFFGVTKLFQSTDISLRRLIYLFIKDMKVKETEVFIVVSSLTKDMNSKEDMFRSNALKVLAKIIDPINVGTIDRSMKTAIVEKNPHIARSALLSGILLFRKCPEIIKKWGNEVQDKLSSSDPTIQYLSIILMYLIKNTDKLSTARLLLQLTKKSFSRNPLGQCQLIRYSRNLLLSGELESKQEEGLLKYIESNLQVSKADMVLMEAARSIFDLAPYFNNNIENAFSVLRMLLSSSRTVTKYAAIKLLNKIAYNQAELIGLCRPELEGLIKYPNRSVASLAISALLKISKENSINSLLTAILQYLGDMSEEFKVDIISSISHFALHNPKSSKGLLEFFVKCMRPHYYGYNCKKEMIKCINCIIVASDESRDDALNLLMEVIEDCPYTDLLKQALHTIGEEVPQSKNPQSYLKFLYNRLILENSGVRAATVSALANIGRLVENIRGKVLQILRKCLDDLSDEVRERANFYLQAIQNLDNSEELEEVFLGMPDFDVDILADYLTQNQNELKTAVDRLVIDVQNIAPLAPKLAEPEEVKKVGMQSRVLPVAVETEGDDIYSLHLKQSKIHEELGIPIFSSGLSPVTDNTSEYSVKLMRHFYSQHIVLHYVINNILPDQILSNVGVKISGMEDNLSLLSMEESGRIGIGEIGHILLLCQMKKGITQYPIVSFKTQLVFKVEEIDSASGTVIGSYDDQYQLLNSSIGLKDYVRPWVLPSGQWSETWNSIMNEEGKEGMQAYQINYKSIEDAVPALTKYFGFHVCDSSDQTTVGQKVHPLSLAAKFLGNIPAVIKAQIGFSAEYGCVLNCQVRTTSQAVVDCILENIS